MKRDLRLYLQDIWDSIEAIEEYSHQIPEDEFFSNQQLQDAVVRRLEIIGEATKNIDEDFRERYPTVPWKRMAGMRDVLIHAHFGVNLKRVWAVLKRDLPELKEELHKVMEKEK